MTIVYNKSIPVLCDVKWSAHNCIFLAARVSLVGVITKIIKHVRIKGRKRSSGIDRIFTVALLLFLAPAGGGEGSNPARNSLTLT